MNDRTRRIIGIVLFILVGCAFGFAIYFLFFRAPTTPTPVVTPTQPATGTFPTAGGAQVGVGTGTGVTPTGPGALPVPLFVPSLPPQQLLPEEGRTRVLSQDVVKAVSISPASGQIRGYNPIDGKFYRYDSTGNAIPLSDKVFYNVENVTWGKQTDKAILEYPDGSKTLYNFAEDQQVTLPKHWEDFDFNTQDTQIVAKAIGNNPTNRFLVVANPDGTDAKAVEELGDNQDKVMTSWSPNDQSVAFSFTAQPLGFDRQQIVVVGKNKENFRNLIVEGRGFSPNWSPTGNNLLYSVYNSENGYKPLLWISGANGDSINENRRSLPLNTWADKCTWRTESELICAVPDGLGDGAGLQRDQFNNLTDFIYRINLNDGSMTNLGKPSMNANVTQPTLSSSGDALIYTDRNSGQLMRFSIQ